MYSDVYPDCPPERATVTSRLAAGLAGMREAWQRHRARAETVAILESLPDRTLEDIGLSRSEIGSAVSETTSDRARRYDPEWRGRGSL